MLLKTWEVIMTKRRDDKKDKKTKEKKKEEKKNPETGPHELRDMRMEWISFLLPAT